MEPPVLLCGLGRVGWRVLSYLQAAGIPVVVIDTTCTETDPRLGNARLVRGDCQRIEVLEAAGVRDCRGVLVVTSNDLLNISTTLQVRALNPGVRIVLRVFNENLLQRLGQALSNVFPLSTSQLTAPVVAVKAMTGQALGPFKIERLAEGRRQVSELTVASGSHLVGRTLQEVTAPHGVLVVTHVPVGGAERFLSEVDLDTRLQ